MSDFNWIQYIYNYKDLYENSRIITKKDAYNHWLNHGKNENRTYKNIINFFNWVQYINNYEDLQINGINTEEKAFIHWLNYGRFENRIINNPINNKNKITNNLVKIKIDEEEDKVCLKEDPIILNNNLVKIKSEENKEDNKISLENDHIIFYNNLFSYRTYYENIMRYKNEKIYFLFCNSNQNEIIPNLWLGCAKSEIYFKCFNFRINMAADLKLTADIHEKIQDNPTFNNEMFNRFERITDIIHTKLNENKRVLVFCYQGVSRSATMVAAYLMKYYNIKKDMAINIIRRKRLNALAILNFNEALTKWENILKLN